MKKLTLTSFTRGSRGIFMKAYEEVIEFIASGTSPNKLITFEPSDVVKDRVSI
jgi:hypothetical protein